VVQECLDRESGRRIYYFLSGYGLRFNEGLARMVAYLLTRQRMSDICITTTDSGFVLSLPASGKVNLPAIMGSIREENCEQLLYRSLQNTSLLKSVFRINATRSFLILKSYKGRQKSARHQQLDADMLIGFAGKLDEFAVLRESFREIIEDRFEVENIKEVLRGLASGEIDVVMKATSAPSPMAFGLATLGASAEERREMMKEMQKSGGGKI
jgi:ATP-dependent Lhr-like helicase